ncbi:hypothetical protein TNCV_2891601 [Trichonephila clavipes]|nr:hypothetical protein TNCV_2891601 [Trichonephila clavipes]
MKEGLIASSYECPKCNDRHDVTWSAIKRFLRNRTSQAEVPRLKTSSFYYREMGRKCCVGVQETFRLVPSTPRLPGEMFQNVKDSMQHRCQICRTTSSRNLKHLL